MIFTGSAVAVITPFDENLDIDYEAFDKIIDFHLENKTDALVVCGTTGEAATMTEEERYDLIKYAVGKTQGKIPVIAGTGSNNSKTSAAFSKRVSEIAGLAGLLVVTPYYNKATKEGLYLHFKTIAESTKLPIILYTVPSRTNINLDLETVVRLAEIENIVGIKDATGDLSYTAGLLNSLPKDFAIYSGNDDVVVPLMSLGGQGVISVIANILPVEIHQMTQACLAGDFSTAADIQIKLEIIIETSK